MSDTIESLRAERDRAVKACEQLIKRFTPRQLRYAPKDREVIGVERPPFEDTTFFYGIMWSEPHQQFMTTFMRAFNGASHFLDPQKMIGLPPQEQMSRAERSAVNASYRAALAEIGKIKETKP